MEIKGSIGPCRHFMRWIERQVSVNMLRFQQPQALPKSMMSRLQAPPGHATPYPIDEYIAEIQQALGSHQGRSGLSRETLEQYEAYLTLAHQMLEDTIHIKSHGTSPSDLDRYRKQQQRIQEQLALTQALGQMFPEGLSCLI